MAELTLNQKTQTDVLKINIGEDSFTIPLAGQLPLNVIKGLKDRDEMLDLLLSYIPEEMKQKLTIKDFNMILTEWIRVSKEESGISLGESQASQG